MSPARIPKRPWFLPVAGGLAVAFLLTFPYALMIAFQAPIRARARSLGRPAPVFSLFGMMSDFDEMFYAARVREASDHLLPYSPYVAENRTPRLLLDDLAGFVAVGRLEALTGDPDLAWTLARAIFVFGWTVVLFALLSGVTENRRAALTCACAVVLFGEYLYLPTALGTPPFTDWSAAASLVFSPGRDNLFLGPTRLMSPCFSFLALMFSGWLTARLASRRAGRFGWAAAGVATGLLAYAHTDVWTVGVAALFGTALFFSSRKPRAATGLWPAFMLALALGAPWIAANFPLDAEFLGRNLGVPSRVPDATAVVFLIGGIAALAAPLRSSESELSFLAWLGSALLGVAVVLNQQILSGVVVQSFHWRVVGTLLSVILAAAAACRWAGGVRGWGWGLAAVLALGLFRGAAYAREQAPSRLLWGETNGALEWLRANARDGAVVATLSPEANMLIPIYTREKTLAACNSPSASDLTSEENARRLAYGARLLSVGEARFLGQALPEPPVEFDDKEYGQGEEYKAALAGERVAYSYIFFSEYPRWKLRGLFDAAFAEGRAFPVDFIWVGPFERELLGGRVPAGLGKPLFEDAWVAVYKAPAV